MTTDTGIALELDDIQAGALRSRPTPYTGAYILVRIDDRQAGRELLRRLIPVLDLVASVDPNQEVSDHTDAARSLPAPRAARRHTLRAIGAPKRGCTANAAWTDNLPL